jgi:hypothetical protein
MRLDPTPQSRLRWPGLAVFALPVIVLVATPNSWPRWAFMWLVSIAVYFACKVLTWSATDTTSVPAWRQWAYLIAWPGMDARRFFDRGARNRPATPSIGEWLAALLKMILGSLIFWGAQYIVPPSSPLILGWVGMTGTAFILHFGLFHLLSCFWRSAGIDAPPIMNSPPRSTSVAEFWGNRWNMAFRDLTHTFLFRPLARRLGLQRALVASFVFSGVVHDLVISIPARGGYGGPTAFFIVQAIAILVEKSPLGRRIGLGRGVRGWLFTAVALLAPARLLFHDPFIRTIVIPFMKALGAA